MVVLFFHVYILFFHILNYSTPHAVSATDHEKKTQKPANAGFNFTMP
jgi:hypothetical protein